MIPAIIRWSVHNRPLVLLASLILAVAGYHALLSLPVDAIPDLSDTQVIVRTQFPGQAPQIVEDQVTYPIASAMLAVPGAVKVRGYSFFGDSYVYVLFDEATDPYWARSRVAEYLSEAEKGLPQGAKARLGPDASGVGWIYEYALIDRSGRHGPGDLRALQDWFLKYELESVPGVAEVATVGGMVKQYQVEVDPHAMLRELVTLPSAIEALRQGNRETGASVLELSEAEYMIRVHGYLQGIDDIRAVGPLGVNSVGAAVYLGDIAEVREGPAPRRGLADLDGQGEVVGGILVLRWQENARETIRQIQARLEHLKGQLPEGIELVETYNRATLIESAIDSLTHRLAEEIAVVVLVCALFLLHLRSALIAALALPLGILGAFVVMRWQGINADIMSLGGIAIAIGAMLDATIVMVENVHKRLERGAGTDRVQVIAEACVQVGPPLFYSLLIIALSFLPVFALEAQEGRLFAPLAYTKTYAMAAAAGLSITLVPVLAAYLVRGHIRSERASPLNRWLWDSYRPALRWALDAPGKTLALGGVFLLSALWPWSQNGSEFMPPLNEGDLLYMPTTLPGISIGKARELLQQTDRLILTQPEVARVFGKVGRAETATDPAPLNMIETTIQLKPRDQWRPGMTLERIKQELDQRVQAPGLVNAWLMPIEARLDMLNTGIKTPIGIKVSGPDLNQAQEIARQVEQTARRVPGTGSAVAERTGSGRYVDIHIDRYNAAQQLFNVGELQQIIASAVGGTPLTETVEGRERYPVSLRYPQDLRDSVAKLRELPIVTMHGELIPLSEFARVDYADGPALIKTEDGRPSVYVFVDYRDRPLAEYAAHLKAAVTAAVELPPGYSLTWAGKYEQFQRVEERMGLIVPLTLAIIFMLLYVSFKNALEPLLIMLLVPFALAGGVWLLYLLGEQLSVAAAIGFIALAGVAAEFGVVMLIYLNEAMTRRRPVNPEQLKQAVLEGAGNRVRPKTMTVAVIVGGLLPILFAEGVGLELMRPVAVPMVGGMLSAPLMSMFLLPVLFYLLKRRQLEKIGRGSDWGTTSVALGSE